MPLKNRLRKHLKTMPFRFQRDGIRFIKKASGRAIIGDDMGVGKTLQILGWLAVNPSKRPVLIGTPANAKFNWAEQIKQHTFLSCQVLSGQTPYPITKEIVIINYDIIHYWLDALIEYGFVVVVWDECHYLKTRTTKRTKSCRNLSRKAKYVLPLSGTPIVNRPAEFFPALNMTRPEIFESWIKYGLNYCGPKRAFKGGLEFKGATNIPHLRKKIKSFFLRRMKSEVLTQLPEKRRTILPVDIDNRAEYRQATLYFLHWYRKKAGTRKAKRAKKAQALVKLGQLKQLAALGKLKHACDWVDDFLSSTDEKLVVFVYHKSVFSELVKKYARITAVGGKSGKKRQEQVKKFQTDPKCRLFIGSIAADKEAITLTASSTVLFLELGWTPSEHDQAEDRVNRIGQTDNKINVYYMLGRNTIDQYVWELIEQKRKVIEEVMNGKSQTDFGIDFSKLVRLLKGKKRGKKANKEKRGRLRNEKQGRQ